MPRQNLWTFEEFRSAVAIYLDVLIAERDGETISLTPLFRTMAQGRLAGRSEGAISRRMSNISYVFKKAGKPWARRFKPNFNNVGPRGTEMILRALEVLRSEAEDPTDDFTLLFDRVNMLRASGAVNPPKGALEPHQREKTTWSYVRDTRVVAWVLQEAHGRCEACEKEAPFRLQSGQPYLEVHHVKHLADGGPDVIQNTVALCPNCHRRLHYGDDARKQRNRLLKKVPRLVDFS